MKSGERGFTFIELLVAIAVIALMSAAATVALVLVFSGTDRSNNYITTVREVQNAGYAISRDAQSALTVTTDDLTPPDFLVLNWTEWDAAGDPIYHSARYFFANLTDGVGKLKRHHWSTAGANEDTLIAIYIYYYPNDADNTSQANYQSPVLTVRLSALFEGALETREYKIKRRPNI